MSTKNTSTTKNSTTVTKTRWQQKRYVVSGECSEKHLNNEHCRCRQVKKEIIRKSFTTGMWTWNTDKCEAVTSVQRLQNEILYHRTAVFRCEGPSWQAWAVPGGFYIPKSEESNLQNKQQKFWAHKRGQLNISDHSWNQRVTQRQTLPTKLYKKTLIKEKTKCARYKYN